MLAFIENGAVAEYPVDRRAAMRIVEAAIEDDQEICLPENLEGVDLSEFGIFPVAPSEASEAGMNEVAEETEPVLDSGQWVQGWALRERTSEELVSLQDDLLSQIDSEAGHFRLRFITDVPGQAETYLNKQAEARAFADDPEGEYPMLEAEASATGSTVAEVAALVSETSGQWRALGAKIEGARMGAKKAVRDASTWAEKQAAAVVDWEALLSP